jgi:hypothetical protein
MSRRNRPRRSKGATGKPRHLRAAAIGGSVAAVVGLLLFFAVYAAMKGGDKDESAPQAVVETESDSPAGEPFSGGPRLHFPVESIDLGQVPFNQHVQYSFAATNAGDAAVHIEDVQVRMLEGC